MSDGDFRFERRLFQSLINCRFAVFGREDEMIRLSSANSGPLEIHIHFVCCIRFNFCVGSGRFGFDDIESDIEITWL
ncbi:hypothetical protein D3C87_1940440 [compost metagenome]